MPWALSGLLLIASAELLRRLRRARAEGRLVGYLAGRTTLVEGLRWGMIVDLLTEDTKPGRDAAAALVAAYNRHLLSQGADVAAALMLKHAAPARALRRNGYIVCPPALLPREFPVLLHWNMPGEPPPRGTEGPPSCVVVLDGSWSQARKRRAALTRASPRSRTRAGRCPRRSCAPSRARAAPAARGTGPSGTGRPSTGPCVQRRNRS